MTRRKGMRRAKGEPEGLGDTVVSMLGAIIAGTPELTFRDVVDDLIVSTVETTDMGWETAILDAEAAHPVERYGSREQAAEGHQRWCKQIVGETSITEIGYGALLEDEPIILRRPYPSEEE